MYEMRDKMKKKINLNGAIDEIKQLAIEFKAQNGNSSLRISNKDFNLWIVKHLLEQSSRIDRVETKQKMLMWFFPIAVALIGLGLIL